MPGSCDVVVVGAGPAGNIAARVLAENGVKTLVLERRQEIGAPKRCGEGIQLSDLERVGVKPDPLWVKQSIEATIIYSPGGVPLEIRLGSRRGYVIERKIFEKHLARDAIRAGARYMVKTTVSGVVMEGGRVVGVRARHMGEEFEVRCKLVIAADGTDSKIARSAGIRTTNRMDAYQSAFQYELAGLNIPGSRNIHLYFGRDIAPGGYAWIFPKGEDVANVGVIVIGENSDHGKKAKDYLDKFILARPEIFHNTSPLELNSGGIPVSPAMESYVSHGLMIIGDAAHQVNPAHAGGMPYGMYAGKMAAEVASKAVVEGDYSMDRLREYETSWAESEGATLKDLVKLRVFLNKLDDDEFDTLARTLDTDEFLALSEGNYTPLLKKFMFKAPKLLPIATKYFR